MKAIVEKHVIIIPIAFWQLLNSLKSAHRDNLGRIVKYNDHSFDSICYLCTDWGDLEGTTQAVIDAIYEELGLPKPSEQKEGETDSTFFTDKGKGIRIWDD